MFGVLADVLFASSTARSYHKSIDSCAWRASHTTEPFARHSTAFTQKRGLVKSSFSADGQKRAQRVSTPCIGD